MELLRRTTISLLFSILIMRTYSFHQRSTIKLMNGNCFRSALKNARIFTSGDNSIPGLIIQTTRYQVYMYLISDSDQPSLPFNFQSVFLKSLSERGFLHQCTDFVDLDKLLSGPTKNSAYLGFDATAKSLHVGSLLQIMVLRHLQKAGHKPVILIGHLKFEFAFCNL